MRLQTRIPLLVVENLQGVDLSFSLDCDILIFATEYSRYHLRGWNPDKTFVLSFDLPVKLTIQQQNSCFSCRRTSRWRPRSIQRSQCVSPLLRCRLKKNISRITFWIKLIFTQTTIQINNRWNLFDYLG